MAEPAGMTVNADIQKKLLQGDLGERKMLLSAVPQVTLMMYELSSPGDGKASNKRPRKFLDLAYDGLGDRKLAKIVLAFRTPDYGGLILQMLKKLDVANRTDPRYLGWRDTLTMTI